MNREECYSLSQLLLTVSAISSCDLPPTDTARGRHKQLGIATVVRSFLFYSLFFIRNF